MQETWEMWVPSLSWEDPLQKEIATHSSILARENSMGRGSWQAMGDWVAVSKELDLT